MTRVQKNGISWFVDDETIIAVLEGLTEEQTTRRTYTVGTCEGRPVFIKYFPEEGITGCIRNKVAARGKKEYVLGKKMRSFSIATPDPLAYGVGKRGSFIVEEFLEGKTFKSCFDEGYERESLLTQLALLLKQLNDRRVVHNDLHLENVIVSNGKVYLIDLHKTQVKKARFSAAQAIRNLTHGLTMVYEQMTEEEKGEFFLRYGQPAIRGPVEAGLKSLKRAWIESKQKRAFSSTSKLRKAGNRVSVRAMEPGGQGEFSELLKKDSKVRVERYTDHIRKIYKNRRRLTRAWKNHVVLEYLDLPVIPRAYFVALPSLGRPGFVAMEDLRGRGEELDRFLDRSYDAMDRRARSRFIDSLAGFLVSLLKKDVFQKDLKACNVFVLAEAFRLLDVEDIVFSPPGEEELKRMLVQLNLSIPARITLTDRMRFLLRVAHAFALKGKEVFREVAKVSGAEEIVYEGVSGLRREAWPVRRLYGRSPFSRPSAE